MKIYVIGVAPIDYTTPLADEMRRQGHKVALYNYTNPRKAIPKTKTVLANLHIGFSRKQLIQRINHSRAQYLVHEVRRFMPDKIVFINANWFPKDLLPKITACCPNIVWLSLDSIELSEHPENVQAIIAAASRVICLDHHEALKHEYLYGKKTLAHCMGYDSSIFFPEKNLPRDIDISFVGTATRARLALLNEVAKYAKKNGLRFEVYGESFVKKTRPLETILRWLRYPHLYKIVKPYNLRLEEAAAVYRRSKICLNIHQECHDILNNRTFEIIACNSFLLVDYKRQLEQLFEPNFELRSYRSIEELLELLAQYISDANARQQLADKAQLKNRQFTLTKFAQLITDDEVTGSQ